MKGKGEDEEVIPDWETEKGVTNDLFPILHDNGGAEVQGRFKDDPYFSQIVDWLTILKTSGNSSEAENRREGGEHLDI